MTKGETGEVVGSLRLRVRQKIETYGENGSADTALQQNDAQTKKRREKRDAFDAGTRFQARSLLYLSSRMRSMRRSGSAAPHNS
jgi:hypothetical protein